MFAPSRDQARRFLFEAWRKYRAGEPLDGLEPVAVRVIAMHPEYHALLDDPERNLDRDWSPEQGTINPFLHLGLHLAIEEQLGIDQPPGLCAEHDRLLTLLGSEHDARHEILECLGETLWAAQRAGAPPDPITYLECLRRRPLRR